MTGHYPTRAAFMVALQQLKHPSYDNRLHLHEYDYTTLIDPYAAGKAGQHTLAVCEQVNYKSLNLSNPNLFDCTYEQNGQTIRAWGWVAFKEPMVLKKPVSYPRAKTTKYRNPELEKSHQLHEALDQQLWDRLQED